MVNDVPLLLYPTLSLLLFSRGRVEERGRTVAEVSCTAAVAAATAAQLSGGRRGHFPLRAIPCNADGSQGYVCIVALTGHIEDTVAFGPRDDDRGLVVL